jgi:hypothetical protein
MAKDYQTAEQAAANEVKTAGPDQSKVASALAALGLEREVTKIIGREPIFFVTAKTVERIKSLVGKKIKVTYSGDVKIPKA